MPTLSTFTPRSDLLSSAGRAAHDVGAAALLGGNLFGRLAMHPALREVSEPRERGSVTNRAWRRYGLVNGLSLGAILVGWGAARADEARPSQLSGRERTLARAKDAAVATVALTGIASAIEGMRFNAAEPNGAVPLTDGNTAAPAASRKEARMKRMLRVVGAANLVAEVALVAINSSLAQANFRRPPLRRLLRR